MSLSDPIADLLTRIRNAAMAKHRYVDIDLSKMKKAIVEVLKDSGFVEHFLIDEENRKMRIFLRYVKSTRRCVITNLRRMSKPGVRHYISYNDIPHVLKGLGLAVLSTSKGVMSGTKARQAKVGGELICTVW